MDGTEMMPVGWNSKKEARNTKHNHGPVGDMLSEKEMIPDGWNSKREDSYNQYDLGAIDKNDSWWME